MFIQPVMYHSEQSSSFNSQGGTYFNTPEKSYSYKKMTDKKSKNTKKQVSLGHTITEYSNPLTSSHTQNKMCNNINSEEKQNCNTNIFNNCIKFKYH